MQGRIIVGDENRSKWVYVPEAHIYFRPTETGQKKLFLAAFRSDGFRLIEGGYVSMEWWLNQCHTTIATLDVQDDMVAFAVESERLRQQEAGGIEAVLLESVMLDRETGFIKFLEVTGSNVGGQTEEEEHAMGLRAQALLAKAGGQQ